MATGKYPSVDAVRRELGNRGSKSTIHRHLRELEDEARGKPGGHAAISEALTDLVARLAERLQAETEVRLHTLAAAHTEELARHRQAYETARAELAEMRRTLEDVRACLADEQAHHRRKTDRLRGEILAHASTTRQVIDLTDLLRAEEETRRALEEKYRHSVASLEHYRNAVKEQREQESRRHAEQVAKLLGEVKDLRSRLDPGRKEAEIIVRKTPRKRTPDA